MRSIYCVPTVPIAVTIIKMSIFMLMLFMRLNSLNMVKAKTKAGGLIMESDAIHIRRIQ